MSYQGDIKVGQTLDFKFSTRRFSTGAPFTLAGSPSLAAYVGNGTTEITAGLTLTVDFDGKTGLNNVRVVATAANGFAAGTDVDIVLAAGTVDSVSVANEVVGSFSIENRKAGYRLTPAGHLGEFDLAEELYFDIFTTDGQGNKITMAGSPGVQAHKNASLIEYNDVDLTISVDHDGDTGRHRVTLAGTGAGFFAGPACFTVSLTGGTINGVDVTGHSLASFTMGFASVKSVDEKTGYSLTQTFPANFASLGINASGHVSRVVLTDTVTTYTGNTIQTGDNFAIVNSVAHGNAALKTIADTKASQASITQLSTDVADVSGAVTALGTDLATVDGIVDLILGDTAELQTDWVNGGRLDLLIDAINAKTTNLPASPAAVGSAMTLTSGERNLIADAYLDRTDGVETGVTPRTYMRAVGAVVAGVIIDAGTSNEEFARIGGSITRVTVTCDASGNRSVVVIA